MLNFALHISKITYERTKVRCYYHITALQLPGHSLSHIIRLHKYCFTFSDNLYSLLEARDVIDII